MPSTSWSPAAIKYLSELQRLGSERARALPVARNRLDRTTLERHGRKLVSSARKTAELPSAPARVPTEHEWGAYYEFLFELAVQIEDAAASHNYSINPLPLIGTLPDGRVNALTLQVPGKLDVLLLFDQGLFTFIYRITRVIAAVSTRRIVDSTATQGFVEALGAYAIAGHVDAAPFVVLDGSAEQLHVDLETCMDLFVLAHEYAHIIGSALAIPELVRRQLTENWHVDWHREWEADMIGVSLLHWVAEKRGLDIDFALATVDCYFGCLTMLERVISVLKRGKAGEAEQRRTAQPFRFSNYEPSSHPPIELRRENAQFAAQGELPEQNPYPWIETRKSMDRILEALWKETRGAWLKAHQDGIQPAPIWS